MEPSADAPQRIGRYAIFDGIGGGGTAEVHLGCKLGGGSFVRMVAVKRLRKDRLNEAEFVSMLIDEARLASRILHANAVPVVDVVHTTGELLLVSEYVHGDTLSFLLRAQQLQGKTTPPPIAAAIAIGVLKGLHAAHTATDAAGTALEIIHRDVSPQNVMVAADGLPRILDFGMAKATGRLTATADGIIKGKLSYMSPEQLGGKPLTAASDVWAAGAVLWEMLTGRRLFVGNEQEILEQILLGDVSPPSRHAGDVSPELDDVVLRALSPSPGARFANAEEMAQAVEAAEPPAYASDVGAWVESLAAERLAERAKLVAQCERAATAMNANRRGKGPRGNVNADDEPSNSAEAASASEPRYPAGRAPRTALLAVLGAIVVAGAIAVVVVLSRPTPTIAAPTPTPSATEPPLVAELPPVTEPLPPATSSSPTPTPAVKRPRAPAVDPCNPPFTQDADGRRVYKRACLK